MITCGSCGTENPAAHSFCSNCGNALGKVCANCGASNAGENRFCFNCGTGLASESAAPVSAAPITPSTDPGTRRLVSVVFADLVGYTTLSEGRDPEDIRSMLTEYYDRCRDIIARYGGVTDKFIGDAVMGVFGADAAHEDDAERATRAAMELIDMVRGLGGDVGMPGLDARAGVMSGEASVGSGGNEHGLVVGDLVNTASRLQSIAPPGGVYVGESTKDLVGSSIEFAAMGEQTVKGKEVPVTAFQAKRVLGISRRRGGELAEGPFVGREDELRLLKDQLHATGRESRARLVSIIGEAGIGKTRLSQELLRYIDGIAEIIYYHNGRSPSYGDGLTFWALGEMIRQRAGILEGEDPARARVKLRTKVAEFAANEDDQRWIEPRLAALIGLAEMPAGDRAELYSALRTFFQMIAEQGTVLMVFEDLHWADEGLLDFIEEMVERSTKSPIMVVALARPELLDRRSDWGVSRRRSLMMHLSRLDEKAMRELVTGLAPGMPEKVVRRIAERTAGVPLHAVEFVRMLMNSGRLVTEDDHYRFTGDGDDFAIPDSVSAIIGARLDRLSPEEAAVIQDASVLGLSFTMDGIAGMRGVAPEDLEPTLMSLVRSDILEFDDDPRSPERGQYRFVQSLIKEVAYGRMPKADRVGRHLEVARHFEDMSDPELAGVVASHYASAAAADPANAELRARARESIIASAERASALHSDSQAASLLRHAIELTEEESAVAALKVRLARSLDASGREDLAVEVGHEALAYYREAADAVGEAQAATGVAHTLSSNFDSARAVDLILPLYESTAQTDDQTWARLAWETSRALALANRNDRAIEVADRAIPVLERLGLTEELLETMNNKAIALANGGRWTEGMALLMGVAELAGEHGLLAAEGRAINNLEATEMIDNQKSVRTADLWRVVEKSGDVSWQIRLVFFSSLQAFEGGEIARAIELVEEGQQELDLSAFWSDTYELVRLQFQQARDGATPERFARIMELAESYVTSDDPSLKDAGYSVQGNARYIQGEFGAAVSAAVEGFFHEGNYPDLIETGLFAVAQTADAAKAKEIVGRIEDLDHQGRAFRGLKQLGAMTVAALEGDEGSAGRHFERCLELWEPTMTPLTLAEANAVAARLLPSEHPAVFEAARAAEAFFASGGFTAYLDIHADTFSRFRDAGEGLAAS